MGETILECFRDLESARNALRSNEYIQSADIECDPQVLENAAGVWVVTEEDSFLGLTIIAAYLTEDDCSNHGSYNEYVEMGV